jgi:hypothetical protein
VQLPENFTCNHCIIQWHWRSFRTGERFSNCFDISILNDSRSDYNNSTSTPSKYCIIDIFQGFIDIQYNIILTLSVSREALTSSSTVTTTLQTILFPLNSTLASLKNSTTMESTNLKIMCAAFFLPPLRTSSTDMYKNNGSRVICYWLNLENDLDCDLCRNNCVYETFNCPTDFCDCRWFN